MAEATTYEAEKMLTGSCYEVEVIHHNEIWKSSNVIVTSSPVLCIQIAFVIFTANIFYYSLRPLRQPRIVAEFLAGFILSPVLLGKTKFVAELLPKEGILHIETYANIGLMGYAFLSGFEMNLDNILQVQKKATSIAIAGIIIPTIIGMALFSVIQRFYVNPIEPNRHDDVDDKHIAKAYLLWTLALTITGFPVLTRILTDLKLLHTKLGRVALTTSMISDTYGWVLFITLIPFSGNHTRATFSVFSTIAFVIFCIFALRPLITRFIDRRQDQDGWDDSQLVFVLLGAFVCSYIADALGTHPVVGAFVYGLILPHGKFTDFVIGRIDYFVYGVISPLFFFRTGFTVDLSTVTQQKYWPILVLVMLLMSIPKVVSTVIVTFFFGIPTRDGIGIGLLLNSKGVLALAILNIGWERKILSVVAFSIMVVAAILMTIMAPLFINVIYKPRKQYERYRLSTIEKLRFDSELRALSCAHNIRQAISLFNVLKAFNAIRISPLQVFGVQLVELDGRATTLYTAHMEQHSHSLAQNRTQPQPKLESIAITFNTLAEENHAIRVETFNAVSAYETIHEDIHTLAEQKRVALILLPFHKQPDEIGGLETISAAFKDINHNVLRDAPCSVVIFVDRGLGSLSKTKLRIVMLFIGGPDDREALAVAWRMAGHPANQLLMVRILLRGEAAEVDMLAHGETQWLSSVDKRQKELDEEYVDSFRFKVVYNDDSITYLEEEVHRPDDLTVILHDHKDDCDLYIVGKGSGRNSAVFSNFLEWCDNPELGVIGDMIVSNSFNARSSLLVVQQYRSQGTVYGSDRSQHHRQCPSQSDRSINTV